MNQYALVEGGVVRSIIVAGPDFIMKDGATAARQQGYPSGAWVPVTGPIGIGDLCADGLAVSSPAMTPHPGKLLLSVRAMGAEAYQWIKDGLDIPGAVSAVLEQELSLPGEYRCIVRAKGRSLTSAPFAVAVV